MGASTIAEIFVEDGSLRVELEIGQRDFEGCALLLPDESYEKITGEVRPWRARLAEFFREGFVVRAGDGGPLAGRLVKLEVGRRVARDEITGEPLPAGGGGEPEPVVVAELQYALPGRPETLTLVPPMDPGGGGVSVTVGFVAYHEGVAVNDFRYLGQEETLDLDWADPWYSAFRNRNLGRQLGEPAQGFIYVEPFEVRKEILVRPRDLQRWVDLGLEGEEVIRAGEHAAIKEKVAAFLAGRCPMTVDGQLVEFEFERIHFLKRTLRQTTVIEEAVDLPAASAVLGAIFVHRRDGLPGRAAMTWDLFDERITAMRGATHDEAGALPGVVTPDDPVLEWKNYLQNPTVPAFVALAPPTVAARWPVPLLSVGCGVLAFVGLLAILSPRWSAPGWVGAAIGLSVVGAIVLAPFARVSVEMPFAAPPPPGEAEAAELMGGLLRNVYRAFDYRDEDMIYDSLARSVSGDLLTEIYVGVFKALVMQGQGGARVRVDELEMLECAPADLPGRAGFRARCRWSVGGRVDHWGHVHRRTNVYEATFAVEPVGGHWRITAQESLGSKRVS